MPHPPACICGAFSTSYRDAVGKLSSFSRDGASDSRGAETQQTPPGRAGRYAGWLIVSGRAAVRWRTADRCTIQREAPKTRFSKNCRFGSRGPTDLGISVTAHLALANAVAGKSRLQLGAL